MYTVVTLKSISKHICLAVHLLKEYTVRPTDYTTVYFISAFSDSKLLYSSF